MINDLQQLKHDFVNNSLRLEILSRIIAEQLQQDSAIDAGQLNDLEKFLIEMQSLVKVLKQSNTQKT